jgi:hypothetical protein
MLTVSTAMALLVTEGIRAMKLTKSKIDGFDAQLHSNHAAGKIWMASDHKKRTS